MMRKIIVGFLALTLALALLSGCGKDKKSEAESGEGAAVVESIAPENNSETSSGTESSVPASNAQVTVEVPNGWSSVEGSAALAQYMNGLASFIVTCDTVPADVKGPDEYVKFAEEQYQKPSLMQPLPKPKPSRWMALRAEITVSRIPFQE